MIILDTSILIELLRGKSNVVDFLKKLNQKTYCISIVTIAEMEFGFHFLSPEIQEKTRQKLEILIEKNILRVLIVDKDIAYLYGKIQAGLRKKGRALSQFDGIIAATALAHSYRLLTIDKDFQRVKGLQLLYPD